MGGDNWRHWGQGDNGDKNGDIRLPAEPLRSDEFVPLKLEWESLDDQPLHEK